MTIQIGSMMTLLYDIVKINMQSNIINEYIKVYCILNCSYR